MIVPGHLLRERVTIAPYCQRTTVKLEILPTGLHRRRFELSYGESHAGYDLRLGKVKHPAREDIDALDKPFWLCPGEFVLGSVMEAIEMPDDLVGIVHDKSTLARLGVAVQNTVIEPAWRGYLTVEISNHGQDAILLHQGMPICQVLFHQLIEPAHPYDGKYQGQPDEPVEAK